MFFIDIAGAQIYSRQAFKNFNQELTENSIKRNNSWTRLRNKVSARKQKSFTARLKTPIENNMRGDSA